MIPILYSVSEVAHNGALRPLQAASSIIRIVINNESAEEAAGMGVD